jgi:hypothetical protein
MQLLTGHLDHLFLEQTRPVELLSAFNHLVVKTISIDVPSQELDRVKSSVGEEEERRLKGVLLYNLPDKGGQPVTTGSHIDGSAMQVGLEVR